MATKDTKNTKGDLGECMWNWGGWVRQTARAGMSWESFMVLSCFRRKIGGCVRVKEKTMTRLALAALAVLGLGISAFAADLPPALSVIKTIPTGSTGRWDYICVDAAARRVYVPRSSHVQVVDLDKSEVIGDIPKTNGVHGVALVPELNL